MDYGESISAIGTIVWEPGGSCPSTPSDVASAGVNPSSTGWRVFIPGYGGCRVGDDGVTCPGEQERGSRESDGVVTVIGETLMVTDVFDNGFAGVAEDWTAAPDADGNADMSTSECTKGGSFLFTTDPEPWQQALGSPIAEESPMDLGGFMCYVVPTDSGAVFVWSMQAALATADPPTPFEMRIEATSSSIPPATWA